MCTPQCICEKLGDLGLEEAIKAWKYVRHYTENLQKLQVKLRDLGDCTATITREVSEAIGRDDEIEGSVMHWQTDADSLKVNIEKLIGESTTKASISCIACSCPNIVWRYKFSKRAEDKIANAVEIIKNCNNFNHQISHPRSHYMENLQKLKDELRDLGDCREIIRGKVSEVNGRGDEIEINVLHWQTDVDSLLVYIEQLIRESTNICSTACPCPDITWQYNFSKQAEEKIADADGLIIKYNNFNQISHPRSHYAENLQKLKDKLRDFGDCREIIRGKVSEANGRGDEIEVNVSHWQTDADSLLDDIEQLIKESTNICSTECPCPDITWQYKFSKQAEEKIANADGLIIKYNNLNKISHPRPRPLELESLSDKNYVNFDSRASIFKDIMDALKDSNVNMIGVFGLGGVGKTTLVKEVGEQMRKDGTFKQVAMAVVSKDLNVKEVQSRLAASLNFKFKAEEDDQVGRATELWNKLTNGDKYLIILDDIWQEVKMEAIGIPCTNEKKGCKVVLTSRKEDLLRITMKADRNFRIGELSEAEAMDLFKKKVGKTIESQPEIDSLAQEVCRKCKGLPVAINAIGAALEDKPYRTWKNALVKLERHMFTQIEGIDPSVWASLYVSYDMLRSSDAQSHSRSSDAQSRSDAQSCFLLCCLFHEDVEIPIDELMRLCIARSLLAQNPFTLDEARNAVHTVVDALKSASLLTTGSHENVVRIHDVIRDVGISIARDQGEAFLIDHGAPRWPSIPTNAPSYSAISLAFKDIKRLPSGLKYAQLHTLIVENSELSDVEFPDNFFNGMTQLSVLEITTMRMQRLPSSLAKLAKLRMLYLDRCELADIVILEHLKSNLEVLGIRRSSIEALPPEIGQLTSLRVLDLQDCDKLRVIPRGVISNLTGLEELYFPFEFAEWKATIDEQQEASNRDNVSLEDLRRLLNDGQLTTLQIHIPDVKLLPNDDLIFANLKGFKISVGSKFDYWERKSSTTRTCMLKAKGIQLRNEFISLVDKAEVLVLEGIQLTVYPFRLSNKYLTVLTIEELEFKYLFTPTTAKELVHLEKLEVRSCEIMEGIVGLEGQNDGNEIICEVKFSKLKKLELTNLRNLKSFYAKKEKMGTTMESSSARAQPLFNEKVIFPALERLTIHGLGNIIKIWDKQSIAHVLEEQGSFCELKSVVVQRCAKLMHVFPSNMHPQLKNLEKLKVFWCETMKGIVEFEGKIDEDGLRTEIAASPALEVEHLEMVGVPKITEIRDKQPLLEPKKEVESLCKLMDIRIEKCGQLLYVFPSHMLPQNLQQLFIQGCDELEVIFSKELKEKEAINNDIIVFPRLKEVSLRKLPKLKSFYTETQGCFFSHKVIFPVLKKLSIRKVHKIIEIWDKQSIAIFEEQGSFCQLKDLDVSECEKLMHVFPSKMHSPLNNLKDLHVSDCPTMKGIVEFEGEINEDGLRNEVCFSELSSLVLSSLPNLECFCTKLGKVGTTEGNSTIHALPLFNGKVAFPVLETLKFKDLHKITRIWDEQPLSEDEKEAKSFCKLMVIKVDNCDQLEYVFPLYILPRLKNLQNLTASGCTKMEVIISNNLKEKEATNNDTIRFPQLKKVKLLDLPNLKSFVCSETQLFFSNKVIFPVLKKLSIRKVHKIIEIWDKQLIAILEEQGSFCQMTDLDVAECEKLMHVFPSKMHSPLKNLKVLRVSDCPTMEGIVDFGGEIDEDGLRNEVCFSELSSLELSSLPNLESFSTKLGKAGTTEGNSTIHALPLFNGKVVFPVLKSMNFWNLDKITGIWDDQPLSEPEKEAKSFSKLEDIIVHGCDQLEHVLPSYMLPQLKNLQELRIWNCTKVEVIISNNPKEKEATNNNDTIRFPQLNVVSLRWLPNLISFICSDEMQLFFSNKDAFPVLEILDLSNDFEFLRNETSTKEECGTSGKESDYNGEELDEDLETPTKENNKMADTSAAQARKGKDIQEIPWERLNITREKYRQTRLEQYKNYENVPQSGKGSEKDCKVTMKGGMYYELRRNSKSVKSTILHHQLRNLVWATSKHDVYLMSHFSVTHWSALTCNKTEVLNVSGHVAPCEKHPGSLLEGFTQTQVSTLAVKDRFLVVGGSQGELICKNLDRPGVCFCTRTTYDDNALTNVVEIYSTQSGAVHLTVANNDGGVRDFDMEKFQLSKHFSFPWPVNHTSMSPDGKLRIIVGDNPEGMLVDSGTGKMVASLVGHLDFSFASAWHPDGLTFATGNEDKTCRIWDARNLSKSVAALKGNLGAIRSIRYSSDGCFMAMAEHADFVHVFDAKSGYEKEQEIDFFGEISGMSFSPDTESLFIGVCGPTYGSLLEFGRRRNNSCSDSII